MSHLHIPDGILPLPLLLAGFVLMVLGLLVTLPATRRQGPRQLAFQSALAGLMLAVMAIPVPVTAFDYCMTLAGPVGVLLGAASAFQACVIVTLILALMGQGGFTVIGLNAIVLGLGAVLARPLYRAAHALGRSEPWAMAFATAASQLLSSALWIALLWESVRLSPIAAGHHEVLESLRVLRGGTVTLVVVVLMVVAVLVESLLGYGLARFLARVRPDLLPDGRRLPEEG